MAAHRIRKSAFLALVGRPLIAAALTLAAALPGTLLAADLSGDPYAYSMIRLTEYSGHGSPEGYSITMSTRDGVTVITTNKNGLSKKAIMPYEECYALWQYVRELDVAHMENGPVGNLDPGQSVFEFTFQIGSETRSFAAYGVDFLEDTRYRNIARAILDLGEKYGA